MNLTYLISNHYDRHEFEDSLLEFTNFYWVLSVEDSHSELMTGLMELVPVDIPLGLYFAQIGNSPFGQ